MIQTEEDIRKWAEGVVAANGEKFTPLTKGEQFIIAKCIMSLLGASSQKNNAEAGKQEPTTATQPSGGELKDVLNNPKRTVTMTRGFAYHHAKFGVQEVYDKFLDDVKNNKAEGRVMDFATGRQSTDAAFAYWLIQTIEVDLPPSVREV